MSGLEAQLAALERGEHDAAMPAYEVERQKKIMRNKILLASLGLDDLRPAVAAPKQSAPKRKRLDDGEYEPQRRSGRVSGTVRVWRVYLIHGQAKDLAALSDGGDSDDEVQHGKRRRNDVARKFRIGRRVYDSVNGTSCHQCRQKTLDPKVECTNRFEILQTDGSIKYETCNIKFDTNCLAIRYGETIDMDFVNSGNWKCPKCRGICNCSFCRRKKGLAPTGQLAHAAQRNGFTGVAEFLAKERGEDHSWREDFGEVPDKEVLAQPGRQKPSSRRASAARHADSDDNPDGSEQVETDNEQEVVKVVKSRTSNRRQSGRGARKNYTEPQDDDSDFESETDNRKQPEQRIRRRSRTTEQSAKDKELESQSADSDESQSLSESVNGDSTPERKEVKPMPKRQYARRTGKPVGLMQSTETIPDFVMIYDGGKSENDGGNALPDFVPIKPKKPTALRPGKLLRSPVVLI